MKQRNSYTGDDLTFVVCAYKECPYLEESIHSLVHQSVRAKILISTSTPNGYIQKIADKYHLEVRVNPSGGQVRDYNFAIRQADTDLVMLAHQDEIFLPDFARRVIESMNLADRPIIAFTDYLELHENEAGARTSPLVRIKRVMLLPLRVRGLGRFRFFKRAIQCFGDPITHPTVVCVRKELPKEVFREKYQAAMDWDLWERLSRRKGSFVYVSDILLYHRMNGDNQTVRLFQTSNARYREEYEIMCRFWPRPIARLIMFFYKYNARYY